MANMEIKRSRRITNFIQNKFTIYIIFSILVALVVYVYTYNITGMAPSYDDVVYAYSIIRPISLHTSAVFGGSIGFYIYGYIFFHLLGNSMIMPTIMTITAIILTMLIIFLIGKEYKNRLAGLVAVILYAFNPIIFAYSNRLLPDIFTTMLLSVAILLFLIAKRHDKSYIYIASGITVSFGIFFGYQAFFTVLIYLSFITAYTLSAYKKSFIHKVLFSIFGLTIPMLLWFLYQQIIYSDPFYLVSVASNVYRIVWLYNFSQMFYLNMLFPFFTNTFAIISATWEPGVNVGILGAVFVLTNIMLLTKKGRHILLPFAFSALVFILYLMFGTQSFSAYSHIYNINRFLIPFILISSLGSALGIGMINNRKIKITLLVILIFIYIVYSLPQYNTTINFYNGKPYNQNNYAVLTNIQNLVQHENMAGYEMYQNILPFSDSLCFIFNTSVANCNITPIGTKNSKYKTINHTIAETLCNQNKTIIITKEQLCNSNLGGSGKGQSYFMHIKN